MFNNYKTYYLFFILTLVYISMVSCSKEELKYAPSNNPYQSDTYNLHVEKIEPKVNSFKMSETKYRVLKDLIHKNPINFGELTSLLIDEQVSYFNLDTRKKFDNVDSNYLNDIITKIAPLKEQDPYAIKQKYESNIKNVLNIRLKKNSTSTNLVNSFKTQSMSDYTSMILDLIMLRLNYSCFKKFSPVIIISKHSKYLGFIKKSDNRLDLIALNHTDKYDHDPIKIFGNLLDYKGPTIRIIDAELFTIMEVFKSNIENISELSKSMLTLTASKYSFSINNQYAIGPIQNDTVMMFNLNYYIPSINASKTPFDFLEIKYRQHHLRHLSRYNPIRRSLH